MARARTAACAAVQAHPDAGAGAARGFRFLLAVEVLLAEPEMPGNDALEVDLYVLRDDPRTKVEADGVTGGGRVSSQ
jgi:hypothetical protein